MSVRLMAGFMMLIGVAAAGCPASDGETPRAACEDLFAALCERFYACLTPAELAAANLPTTEAACETQMQAAEGCSNQTTANVCTGNERYHPDQASECVTQVSGLTCGQLRDQGQNLDANAPACGKVCAID